MPRLRLRLAYRLLPCAVAIACIVSALVRPTWHVGEYTVPEHAASATMNAARMSGLPITPTAVAGSGATLTASLGLKWLQLDLDGGEGGAQSVAVGDPPSTPRLQRRWTPLKMLTMDWFDEDKTCCYETYGWDTLKADHMAARKRGTADSFVWITEKLLPPLWYGRHYKFAGRYANGLLWIGLGVELLATILQASVALYQPARRSSAESRRARHHHHHQVIQPHGSPGCCRVNGHPLLRRIVCTMTELELGRPGDATANGWESSADTSRAKLFVPPPYAARLHAIAAVCVLAAVGVWAAMKPVGFAVALPSDQQRLTFRVGGAFWLAVAATTAMCLQAAILVYAQHIAVSEQREARRIEQGGGAAGAGAGAGAGQQLQMRRVPSRPRRRPSTVAAVGMFDDIVAVGGKASGGDLGSGVV